MGKDYQKMVRPEKIIETALNTIIDELAYSGTEPEDIQGMDLFMCVSIRRGHDESVFMIGTSTGEVSQQEIIKKLVERVVNQGDLTVEEITEAAINGRDKPRQGISSGLEQRVLGVKKDGSMEVDSIKNLRPETENGEAKKEEEETPKKEESNSIMGKIFKLGKF